MQVFLVCFPPKFDSFSWHTCGFSSLSQSSSTPDRKLVFFQPGPYWSNCCSLQPSWDGNQVGLGVSATKASDSVALTPNYSSFSGFHASRCFLVDFQSPQMVTLTIFCTRFTGHAIPIQFSHSVVSNSLRPHESQHARPPCPSPTPGVHTNSCPLSR